jgi:hypothetical protein
MSKEVLISLNQFQILVMAGLGIVENLDKAVYLIKYGAELRQEWKAMRYQEALKTPRHMLLKQFDAEELQGWGYNVEVIKEENKRYNERRYA